MASGQDGTDGTSIELQEEKDMKRAVSWFLALVLLMALAAPALADTMYLKKRTKLYEEPDDDSEELTTLHKGDEVEVLDFTGSSWSMVSYDGYEGFVKAKYLTDEEECDHEWGKWKIIREATCTRKGERERTCELCGEVQTEEIKKADHDFGKWDVIREADCTHTGERERECVECGYVQTETIPKTEHEYGKWSVTEEPTDHSTGIRSRSCRICGYTEEEEFDPDGTLRRGDRGDDVRALQEQLIQQGYLKSRADGSFGSSTEVALKKFQQDQQLNPDGVAWPQTIKRLNHDFGPWETVKAPTRTDAGERARTCRDCGYQETQAIPMEPVLTRRDRGEGVRFVQTMLNDLGYNAGGADGVYGGKLDTAFTAFAKDVNVEFVPGTVCPADIDALLNKWVASLPAEQWMGRTDSNDALDPVLTVNPIEESTDDLRTYEWTLTNLGTQRCQYKALLLNFGKDSDFRSGNFVLAVDNAQLKANGGNTLTGTITVATAWGGLIVDSLNFCALVTSENGAEKWLTNSVVYEVK